MKTARKNKFGFYPIEHLFTDKETVGTATIEKAHVNLEEAKRYNLRLLIGSSGRQYDLFEIQVGTYVRLMINNELMMSDTPMEQRSNQEFIEAANGDVLVAGLGIGLILKTALLKREVKSITVIEKNQDVINITLPKIKHEKLNVVCCDIHDYLKSPELKAKDHPVYDTIYFDIWPDISTKNLPEIKKLEKAYLKYLNKENPKVYIGSWMKSYLQNRKRRGF